MPQVFHRSFNTLSRVSIVGGVSLLLLMWATLYVVGWSPYVTDADIALVQPLPFSHQHHVTDLGIDCRYCHTSVESSSFAGVPPTKTCMNCHQEIWFGSPTLEPVSRELSRRGGDSLAARPQLAALCLFQSQHPRPQRRRLRSVSWPGGSNAIHLSGASLLMSWCVNCHRDPSANLRPRDAVFDMTWQPPKDEPRLGGRPDETVPRTQFRRTDQLLDVPPMNTATPQPLDWDAIRHSLAAGDKPSWRGLEELAETPAFAEMIQREFPDQAAEWTNPVTRRQFLLLMGVSWTGRTQRLFQSTFACRAYSALYQAARRVDPGKPLFYATAMPLGGLATGLLVESHEGRPTKVEGNPHHPASLGTTDVFAQASVLGLYDPDRSQTVTHLGRPRGWGDAKTVLRNELEKQRKHGGVGLRVLTGTVTSPTLADQLLGDQLGSLRKEFPEAKWVQYGPAYSGGSARALAWRSGGRSHRFTTLI